MFKLNPKKIKGSQPSQHPPRMTGTRKAPAKPENENRTKQGTIMQVGRTKGVRPQHTLSYVKQSSVTLERFQCFSSRNEDYSEVGKLNTIHVWNLWPPFAQTNVKCGGFLPNSPRNAIFTRKVMMPIAQTCRICSSASPILSSSASVRVSEATSGSAAACRSDRSRVLEMCEGSQHSGWFDKIGLFDSKEQTLVQKHTGIRQPRYLFVLKLGNRRSILTCGRKAVNL